MVNEDLEKSLEIFKAVVNELSNLIKKDLARISLAKGRITIQVSDNISKSLIKEIPKEVLETVIEEIIFYIKAILDDNEKELYEAEKEKNDITTKKVELIKANLIDYKLKKRFYFINSCLSKTLKSVLAQPIIKPLPELDNISSMKMVFILNNNIVSENEEYFEFEIDSQGLENLIDHLKRINENLKEVEKKNR